MRTLPGCQDLEATTQQSYKRSFPFPPNLGSSTSTSNSYISSGNLSAQDWIPIALPLSLLHPPTISTVNAINNDLFNSFYQQLPSLSDRPQEPTEYSNASSPTTPQDEGELRTKLIHILGVQRKLLLARATKTRDEARQIIESSCNTNDDELRATLDESLGALKA